VTAGLDVLFDLDVKGALKLKQSYPDALLIFLMPPSLEILERRLQQRGTEDNSQLQRRLTEAKIECEQASKFDYVVVNDNLEETVSKIEQIIRSST